MYGVESLAKVLSRFGKLANRKVRHTSIEAANLMGMVGFALPGLCAVRVADS